MSKFHINSKGEAGQCSATKGNCPFGGDENHYDSVASAQKAFEEQNAGNLLPSTKKAKPNEKFAPNLKREDFDYFKSEVHLWGRENEWEDLVFDESAIREKLAGETDIDSKVEEARQEWMLRDRDWPAQSGETVPARLIPLGSKVYIKDPETGEKKRVTIRTVGNVKQPNGKFEQQATYRYKGEDHHVGAYDKLEVETAGPNGVPRGWISATLTADSLLRNRREAHNFDPEQHRKDKVTISAMKGLGGKRDLAAEEEYINRKRPNLGGNAKHPGIVEGPRQTSDWNPIKKGEMNFYATTPDGSGISVTAANKDEVKGFIGKSKGINASKVKVSDGSIPMGYFA